MESLIGVDYDLYDNEGPGTRPENSLDKCENVACHGHCQLDSGTLGQSHER